jgi:hypothetical protein
VQHSAQTRPRREEAGQVDRLSTCRGRMHMVKIVHRDSCTCLRVVRVYAVGVVTMVTKA